jgi:phosphohistidine phosphatase
MAGFTVFLVRHAKAEKAPSRGQGDAARALTPEGRTAFAALLGTLGDRLRVARIVTSPFVRARETAELLARATGAPVEEDLELASGASGGGRLLGLARAAGAGAAVVGHNPEVAEAVALAAGEDLHVRPGTVAAVELEGSRARLLWIAEPERAGE